jgi:integrase
LVGRRWRKQRRPSTPFLRPLATPVRHPRNGISHLATAYEDGQLRSNPAAGVRVVVKDRRTRVPKWLTSEQTKALLAEMPAKHADLAYFITATGCRISEALGARWGDIGPDQDGQIVVRISEAKTEAGLRAIPLSPETSRRLTKRRAEARHASDDDPIFPSTTGTLLEPRNWRKRVFKPAAERAGVPWATPHKLRHGLASLMAHQGYSAAQIASHLGHADGGVLALKTYIHADQLDDPQFIDEAFRD